MSTLHPYSIIQCAETDHPSIPHDIMLVWYIDDIMLIAEQEVITLHAAHVPEGTK